MTRLPKTGIVIGTLAIILGATCVSAQTQPPPGERTSANAKVREDPSRASVVEDEARWNKAINLLVGIDPAKDVKGGKWEIKERRLTSDGKWGAHIQVPYRPPEEYDYRVFFTKLKPEGKLDGLNLWLPRSGRTVAWCIGGWGNTISGLEFVSGVNPSKDDNPTGVKQRACLQIGRKHTVVVRVRKGSVMGYLDGQLLTKWKGDWKDLSFPDWVSRTQLEIATYSPTVFHSIELLEVTGKGRFTRERVPPAGGPAATNGPKRSQHVAITIVYDNNPLQKQLETAWGFACIVEGLSETILFDTGGKGKLLLSNMAAVGFKPGQIDSVVLSHIHADHTGGLQALLQINSDVKVFVPKAFPSEFKQAVAKTGARLMETDGPQEICRGAWTTGVLKQGLPEQGLYLKTFDGLVVITGCAHPGIVEMAKAARRHAELPVYAVLGGFHMGGASADKIGTVIRDLKEMGVRQVAPCHCSGDKTRELMKAAFGEGYLPLGVGARLVFDRKRQPENR